MRLVLVKDSTIDERLEREKGAINEMKNNIDFCNKAIIELIDPIVYKNTRINVNETYDDYRNLQELRKLLESHETRKMFKTIQADLHKNLPSNLEGFCTMSEVRDLLESDLQADTVYYLIDNIETMLSKKHSAKNDKEGSHIINFLEDGPWGR